MTVVGTVVGTALFVALVVVTHAVWVLSIRYAADIEQVKAPDGRSYDVLVHRDGVLLSSKNSALFNVNTLLPTYVALLRHWFGRQPWRWAVTVRPSPFRGYRDLLREVFENKADARNRSEQVIAIIEDGKTLWPAEAEWFR